VRHGITNWIETIKQGTDIKLRSYDGQMWLPAICTSVSYLSIRPDAENPERLLLDFCDGAFIAEADDAFAQKIGLSDLQELRSYIQTNYGGALNGQIISWKLDNRPLKR
jgi:hypothetical protein